MKNYVLGLFAALLIGVTAWAGEVDIPEDKRVKNQTSGCCVWAACEALGNIHNVKALNGITKYRHDNYGNKPIYYHGSFVDYGNGQLVQIQGPHWGTTNEAPGTPARVKEEFERLKVVYKLQEEGNVDLTLIKDAVKRNLGAAIGVKGYPKDGDYHMVTLTDLTNDKAIFVDPNDLKKYEKPRDWFDKCWKGYTIVIYPASPCVKNTK